jgi:flagellar basal-body rod modification protein FlgD
MSTITPLQNTVASSATTPISSTPTQAEIGSEFNSFIKLLTAQIRNQDPLAPLDSTQFVEQLATFSTLEQQVGSNSRLDGIASIMSDLHAVLASDWLGERVTVESSWVPFSGDPVSYQFDRPEDVDRAVLTIRGHDGTPTWSETLDLNEQDFSWDGRRSDGTQIEGDTLNQFSIDLFRSGEYVGSVAPHLHTTVTDVATENGQLRFGTDLKISTSMQSIRKIDSKE